ncbi:MAG: PEP-CTERM sorting domain-containing protein [Planctomycetes bacterium]|nr:PEP-CTERM sorting domain-containing protein [Planctomycetota bacterium]
MKKSLPIIFALLLAAPAWAEVQLDISGGFTMDAIVGPLELQAIYNESPLYGAHDLMEVQGGQAQGVGWWVYYQSTMMFGNSSTQPYSIDGQWFHPSYKTGTKGLPEYGIVTGAGYTYHMASHGGNATLAGDWLEVASPSFTWDYDAGAVSTMMAIQPNAMVVGSQHSTATWQIASATAMLPVAQQGQYSSINFVLAAHGSADGARNMQIVALYSDATEQVLYTFSSENVRVGPVADDSVSDVYDPLEFNAVYNFEESYNSSSGASGSLSSDAGTLFEFATALALDPTRTLVGIRLEDNNPTLNWNSRGLTLFAASAALVPEPATMALLGFGLAALLLRRRT